MILTLAVPATRNAISRVMSDWFAASLDAAAEDRAVRAIVITGGRDVFSSGGDFGDMRPRALADWREHFDHMARLTRRLLACPKPTVAAVEGWAIGGGLALACCCDRIVAAENARFVYGFDRMAVLPDVGLMHSLPTRLGVARSRRFMAWGESVDAWEAKEAGLVDMLAPPGEALEQALASAEVAARGAPLVAGLIKAFLADGLEEALRREKDCASCLFTSEDHHQGLATFRRREEPVFTGR